ncbi:unnamed protein product [Meloidogyne enterolobii]|uniref:Uncharacterized protein n=1 Tax=Meloidogyne enterolobii TaxID=390850 RepID=A0ACB0ZGA2_MELEN
MFCLSLFLFLNLISSLFFLSLVTYNCNCVFTVSLLSPIIYCLSIFKSQVSSGLLGLFLSFLHGISPLPP